jgi:DNA-binding protein YbaB
MGIEPGQVDIGNSALAAVLIEVDEQRDRLRVLAEEMRGTTVEATSKDRLITVVINARGLLTGLSIDPLAMRRYRAGQLADEIALLVRRADEELTERRNRLAGELVQYQVPGYSDLY